MRLIGGGLAVLAVVSISASALAVTAADAQRRIVVRLAPVAAAPLKVSAGQTGRLDFDRVTTTQSVGSLRRIFAGHSGSTATKGRAPSLGLGLEDFMIVAVPDDADPDALLDAIRLCPDVIHADFDGLVHATGAPVVPGDPYYATHQYSLNNTGTAPPYDPGTSGADIAMEAAWAFTTGDTNVILAIIDTGIDWSHPDLTGRRWTNYGEDIDNEDQIDNDGNGYVDDRYGWNFYDTSKVTFDNNSHGTHVAGIAAANGDNGIGVAGIDWNCRVMTLKALDQFGSGFSSDLAAAMVYAVDNGADVMNLSLGGPDGAELEAATAYAEAAGVVVVAAMGNANANSPLYPGAYPSAIAVGATDSDDHRAVPFCYDTLNSGSNYGSWIDVCAPGDYIWSTKPSYIPWALCVPAETTYSNNSGTSMATPHVAGVASLIRALRPNYPPDSVSRLLSLSADDQVGRPEEDTPGFDIYHGWGRINARVALQALAVDLAPIITVPGPQAVVEADTISFVIFAFDSNFTTPSFTMEPVANVTLTDAGNGTASVTFAPDYTQAGLVALTFIAGDGTLADTGTVVVDVAQGCLCPCQGDPVCDGVVNVLDVVSAVEIAFRGGDAKVDDSCYPHPGGRTDINCDGFTNVLDVVQFVGVAFRSQPQNFCDPCQP